LALPGEVTCFEGRPGEIGPAMTQAVPYRRLQSPETQQLRALNGWKIRPSELRIYPITNGKRIPPFLHIFFLPDIAFSEQSLYFCFIQRFLNP
jgi:hypothetical protein